MTVVLTGAAPGDATGAAASTVPAGCAHQLGGLPCVNSAPHTGKGRGCVHHSTSGLPHQRGTRKHGRSG
jgi:hypothetical protein